MLRDLRSGQMNLDDVLKDDNSQEINTTDIESAPENLIKAAE